MGRSWLGPTPALQTEPPAWLCLVRLLRFFRCDVRRGIDRTGAGNFVCHAPCSAMHHRQYGVHAIAFWGRRQASGTRNIEHAMQPIRITLAFVLCSR